jgi:hypothetical protein
MNWNDIFDSARSWLQWAVLHDLPPGWALLAGLGGGLCVIAWQINRGLRYLIKTQQTQAELNRQATLQQPRTETGSRTLDGKTIAAALIGELTACYWTRAAQLKNQIGEALAASQNSHGASTGERFSLYQSIIPQLGLLGASLVSDVVTLYSVLQMAHTHVPSQAELTDIAKVITRLKAFQEGFPDPVFPIESSEKSENLADTGEIGKTILVTRHGT